MTPAARLEGRPSFDYVVIGAGAAGCALAYQLSGDPDVSVLVLEAGGEDVNPDIRVPQRWLNLLGSDADWKYWTVPQRHCADRRVYWPRGRVLGGSTAINAMVFMRGHPNDYDNWAAQGCPGWNWESVKGAFKELEHFPQGSREHRGVDGPVKISFPEMGNPFSESVRTAMLDLGLPQNDDFNDGDMDGVGWNQLIVWDGQRRSAAEALLRPAVARGNVEVWTNAHVRRLIIDPSGVASGVEYERNGQTEVVSVVREVALAAGAIDSPKLLMLSGIGPAAHLREHSIDATVDLPGVGKNLHDHPGIGITFEARRPVPTGVNQLSELGMFTRFDAAASTPQVQFGVIHVPVVEPGFEVPEHGFSFVPSWAKPLSRGEIRLRSGDPMDAADIDPNYLSDPADRDGLVQAIELSREVAHAGALKDWTLRESAPGNLTTRADLGRYVEQASVTWYHPVGSCRMGIDDMAVVDPRLVVRGTSNVRVVDVSVMPEVPSANTMAPAMVIGWIAGRLMREDAQ